MSKKNFDTLEIGKYYVSKARPLDPVRITRENLCGGTMEASNGSSYSKKGQLFQIGETEYDLITEVTVTITPVVTKKPREFWVVYHGDKALYAGESKEDVERKMLENISMWGMDAILPIVRMREVMEGEE